MALNTSSRWAERLCKLSCSCSGSWSSTLNTALNLQDKRAAIALSRSGPRRFWRQLVEAADHQNRVMASQWALGIDGAHVGLAAYRQPLDASRLWLHASEGALVFVDRGCDNAGLRAHP